MTDKMSIAIAAGGTRQAMSNAALALTDSAGDIILAKVAASKDKVAPEARGWTTPGGGGTDHAPPRHHSSHIFTEAWLAGFERKCFVMNPDAGYGFHTCQAYGSSNSISWPCHSNSVPALLMGHSRGPTSSNGHPHIPTRPREHKGVQLASNASTSLCGEAEHWAQGIGCVHGNTTVLVIVSTLMTKHILNNLHGFTLSQTPMAHKLYVVWVLLLQSTAMITLILQPTN